MINAVIDISHWQKIFDFDKIKQAGIVGVIHKATEGQGFRDSKFDWRRQAFKEQGFLFGSYHFLSTNGTREAERYFDIVKPDEYELIMLDTESQKLTTRNNILESEKFVQRFYELSGRYPVWYIGMFLLNQYASFASYKDSILLNCPLFVARYSRKQPAVPTEFKQWTLWQYTQDGVVPGITTVDRDIFNGDMEGLMKLWSVSPERAKAFEGINVAQSDNPDNFTEES